MAAPNVVNVATITGKTDVQVTTTTPTAIVSNAAASGDLVKINALYVSNVDGTADATVNVDIYRSATAYRIAHLVNVPAEAAVVIIAKDAGIYLEEGDDLRITASVDGDLESVCSYEIISE